MAGNVAHSARNPAYNRPPGLRSVRWSVERVDRGMEGRGGRGQRKAGREKFAQATGEGEGVAKEAAERTQPHRGERKRHDGRGRTSKREGNSLMSSHDAVFGGKQQKQKKDRSA